MAYCSQLISQHAEFLKAQERDSFSPRFHRGKEVFVILLWISRMWTLKGEWMAHQRRCSSLDINHIFLPAGAQCSKIYFMQTCPMIRQFRDASILYHAWNPWFDSSRGLDETTIGHFPNRVVLLVYSHLANRPRPNGGILHFPPVEFDMFQHVGCLEN